MKRRYETKRGIALVVCMILLLSMMSACGTSKQEPKETATTQEAAAKEDTVVKEIKIAAGRTFWQGPTTNIFIHSSTNVWESLVMFDEKMEPVMQLAESVEPSEDGLTWTIKLREGVKFHDGSDFTADVAAFNLERLYHYNPAESKYDAEYEKSDEYGKIISIDVVSDYELQVKHELPIPDFDARLSLENGAMFAMASFDDEKAIQQPYGTGPYVFDAYDEQNQILTLKKFTEYRKGEPKLDTVYFYNIPDAVARLSALQSGEIDVISDVGGLLPQQAAEVDADPNLQLKEREVSTVHYLGVNNNEGKLFHDVRLRQALSMSIDRDTIAESLLLGYGKPAISVLTDISSNWTVDCGYRYDVEGAKKLVEEAVGEEKPTAIILVNSALVGRWSYQDVAAMLQNQLIQIGIDAQIETVDAATWGERMKNGEYDFSPHPFTVSAGEPNYFFTRNILSTGSNNIARGYGIADSELDALIEKVAVEQDATIRKQQYGEIQTKIKENEYMIPMWYDVTLYAMNNKVKDFELDVLFCPDLFAVDIEG